MRGSSRNWSVSSARARALAAYDLAPAPRAANGSSVTVAEWVEHHIEHLIGCEQKTIDEYRRFLKPLIPLRQR